MSLPVGRKEKNHPLIRDSSASGVIAFHACRNCVGRQDLCGISIDRRIRKFWSQRPDGGLRNAGTIMPDYHISPLSMAAWSTDTDGLKIEWYHIERVSMPSGWLHGMAWSLIGHTVIWMDWLIERWHYGQDYQMALRSAAVGMELRVRRVDDKAVVVWPL